RRRAPARGGPHREGRHHRSAQTTRGAVVAAFLLCLALAQAGGPAHRDRGLAFLQKGDIAAALPELRAAVAADPADAAAQDAFGVALGESGQTEAARAAFREAIRLDPRRSEFHFHLGAILDRLGRGPEAITAFESAWRLDPDSVDARYGLSVVLAKQGDLDGAIQLLREVTTRAPGRGEAQYDLGLHLWNRYRAGRGLRQPADLDEADRALRAAVAVDPQRARWRLALGQLMAERQRLDDAVAELRQAAR